MARLSAQSIRDLCVGVPKPMLVPFQADKLVVSGKSCGLSAASYDCRINHDLVLGPHPGYVLRNYLLGRSDEEIATAEYNARIEGKTYEPFSFMELRERFKNTPECYSLAYTIEKFHMPNKVSADVADKSTYARLFVSHFNTFIDPGFIGDLTLEIINLGNETIEIKAGDPICQIIFTWLDEETEKPYGDGDKYQHQKGATPAIMERAK